MLNQIRPALTIMLLMTILTGLIYPLAITGIAQILFHHQANGSLVQKDGKIIGSHLIGQNFAGDSYFHGRPSATTATDPADATKTIPAPYNAANSAGSNLGPTSQALIDGVRAAAEPLHVENEQLVPVDLVTASGSGLDPDITPAAARFQILRVAKTRQIPENILMTLVAKHTKSRVLGIFGEPIVNVLELNLALDRIDRR